MTCPGEGILTDLTRRLVDKGIKEVNYFCHFESHDREFKEGMQQLIRKLEKVHKEIEDAKRNNQHQIEGEVQDWIEKADNLIQNTAEIRPTRFDSWCPLRQYRQGKRLAQRTLTIEDLIKKCDFVIVARQAELLYMKYHASSDFIDFESRKTKFNQLVEVLEDKNHHMIGLQGMGGTGKTTLATQVGKQVEESKAFEKVIFVVVSNPPDVNKIQGDIARQLGLRLEESKEVDHSKVLWSSIYNNKKKLLIILDDVWEELNLKKIGIPSGLDHKNCYVLITTRHYQVCRAMKCQPIVCLDTLGHEEALTLFLSHARNNDANGLAQHYSRNNDSNGLAQHFVKECGGLPTAIVALGSVLRNWPEDEWNVTLAILRDSKPLVDVDEDLVTVYRCLKLSYDKLNDKKAQNLFLLGSIFPEDYEIPISLIIRLGIGSGIFGEVDGYCVAKIQALSVKNKLIDSSLLQKVVEKGCVKMHDLVREVAQWIAKEDIQVIMNPRTTLEINKRFVFWSTVDFPDFPNQFDDTKLEILLLWISGNVLVKDPNAFFARMSRLKILFLLSEYGKKVPSPSLSKSLLSLKDIHTLILDGWELGDISILKNIKSLVTLEFKNCLIIELPINIMELKKLRWLGMRNCEIQKNNPFEVIEKCSHLEELYFVENFNVEDWNTEDEKKTEDEIAAQDRSPLELKMFSITYHGFKCFAGDDNGLRRCFKLEHIKHLISDAMFKYFVRSAEVLELGNIGQTRWQNLAPDIIPLENGGMDNLIKLYLYEWDDIECLIDNRNATFVSKLVELHLYRVDVKKLYWGAMPSHFHGQLQILELKECMKLQNIFFDENIELPHLKVLRLIACPMFQPSIFHPSVAESLKQLEELVVERCKELKSLIAFESQKNSGVLFPMLKSLRIEECGELEMIFSLLLPEDLPKLKDLYIDQCEELKYIFGEYRVVGQFSQQEIMLPLLTEVTLHYVPSLISIFQKCPKCVPRPPQVFEENSKDKDENSKASAFSWAYGCCFLAPTKDTNTGVSNATIKHHRILQGSCGSNKRMETVRCLIRHPLILRNIREMKLWRCSKLKSLFSVSIATTMMLETLHIWRCGKLKHIITNKAEDDDHLNCTSIFPKLESLRVRYCDKLEFVFPSTFSGGIQKLKSIDVWGCDELKFVFGKYNEEDCVSNENENNDEPHIHLLALEKLSLRGLPRIISIGVKKYQQKCPSLRIVEAPKEIKQHMQDVTSERVKESELQDIVSVETPMTPIVGFQYFLNFQNLKEIQIMRNKKLKILFSVSACRNLPQLSKLTIDECEDLVSVVENDSHDHHHMNYSSIFPKLEDLSIGDCNKLEFIFHLPASLERLSFVGVPKIMNKILAKTYHVSFLSLRSIGLGGLQVFKGRSFLDLMAYLQEMQLNVKVPKELMNIIKDMQKLTNLQLRDSKIEEVLNLEGVEIEGTVLTLSLEELHLEDLSELNHICKGPKYILRLPNLRQLDIVACKKLRIIFSVSIVKSLPQLSYLNIRDCNELMDIIEESVEVHLHQICFPELATICICRCNSLKCLFSISTSGMFPKLCRLEIEEAGKLVQVFIRKQDDMQKMTTMDKVFPELSRVTLRKLRRLVTICQGIDFQTLEDCKVIDCPKYQGINHIEEELEDGDSQNQTATNTSPGFAESSKEAMTTSVEAVASSFSKKEPIREIEAKDPVPALLEKQASEGSTTKPQLRSTSLHNVTSSFVSQVGGLQSDPSILAYKDTEKEVGKAIPASSIPATTSLDFEVIVGRSRREQNLVASMKEKHEQGSQGDDVTRKAAIAIQSTDSESAKQARVSSITTQVTRGIKDTMGQGHKENYPKDDAMISVRSTNSNSRKQSTEEPIDNLSRKDYDMTIEEAGDRSSVQNEVKSERPIKAILPQVLLSAHYQSQYADTGSSSPKLGICEIFRLVELKLGETALLAQALEQYPQLLLPRVNRTHRIIAWSYRVLVDILVMLDTKTPNTISQSEKSTLEANLSEAIVLGFDKYWVESIRAKVFVDNMSDVSTAKEEIQVMEAKLEEIESQLLGLSECRKKLIENMTMFRDVVSAKDKAFGI